jgi:hypothetical protein
VAPGRATGEDGRESERNPRQGTTHAAG